MRERLTRDRKQELNPDLKFRMVESGEEHERLLIAKLLEETAEVIDAIGRKGNVITELVDVYEVVKSLAMLRGCAAHELVERAGIKRMAFGGFTRGLVYIEYPEVGQ